MVVLVAIALEPGAPLHAVGRGLRLAFAAGIGRFALAATIVLAISLFGWLALEIGALLDGTVHAGIVSAIATGLEDVGVDVLLTAFVVVYRIDVRVRNEGYDLWLAAHEPPK
jgi:hypothetical protein